MRFLAALLLLSACGGDDAPAPQPGVWQAGPDDYSAGTVVEGNVFTLAAQPPGLHYATQPLSLAGATRITLRYTVTGETYASSAPGEPATISLYFQRKGDDWSGEGKYATYRWWAATQPLTPGDHEITASLDGPGWTSVYGGSAPDNAQAFADAKATTGTVGFTLGGAGNFGHGAYGPATLTVTSFEVGA